MPRSETDFPFWTSLGLQNGSSTHSFIQSTNIYGAPAVDRCRDGGEGWAGQKPLAPVPSDSPTPTEPITPTA